MAKKQGLIYVLQSESLPHNICKIGQTINWIGENSGGTSHRKVVLQTSLPHEIYPVALFVVSNMDSSEGFLQNVFSLNNLQYGGGTEWFFIPQDYLKIIIEYSDIDCLSEFKKVESDKKADWLKSRIAERQVDKNFKVLETEFKRLISRKIFYLKYGEVYCQGVFEDDKFIILKGSVIASKPLEENRTPKADLKQERNFQNIIESWKEVKRYCKKNSLGLYVLTEDIDVSNFDKITSSMRTQGLVRSNVDWTRSWKFLNFTLKELKEAGKIEYPNAGKEGPYRWLK